MARFDMNGKLLAQLKRQTKPALCIAIGALASMLIGLTGCSHQNAAITKTEKSEEKDPAFVTFVSMAPSNTELIYTLQGDKELLGVCTQCDYPKDAAKKPKAGSFTNVDLEKLALLHPDGVFLVGGQEGIAETLKKHGIRSVLLRNNSVHDVSANIRRIGRIIHRSAVAMTASSEFDKHVELVRHAVAASPSRPTVFFCVWPDPLLTVGPQSYLNDAITICGGKNIAAELTGDYPHFNSERLLSVQPDVIILPHEADNPDFLKHAPWSSLKAVKEKRCYFLPPKENDRLERPTTRLTNGLLWLAARIHPEADLP